MNYRDLEGYDPDQPPPPPPTPRPDRTASQRRSPAGPVLAIVATAALVVGAVRLFSDADPAKETAGQSTSSASSTAAAPASSSSSSVGSTSSTATATPSWKTSLPPTDRAGVQRVARSFLAAWARPDLSAARWHDGVVPFVTAPFRESLRSVNPVNVPAKKVKRVRVEEVNPTAARALAQTDGGEVRVMLQRTETGWKVSGIEPVHDDLTTETD